jgi:hypothetical protein
MEKSQLHPQFEVLSPWAETDPVPLRGISPRLPQLDGKKIGLFYNSKRAARPMLETVERKLKERFPTLEVRYYASSKVNCPEIETGNKGAFQEWVRGVDAVITAVGD